MDTSFNTPPPPEGQGRFKYSKANISNNESPGDAARSWKRLWVGMAAAAICFVAFYPSALQQLLERWITDSAWSHGLVVPLICLFFVRLKWDILRRLEPRRSLAGLAILILGVISQILFRATGLLHMSNLSIVVVLLGAMLYIFGWDYLKLLWLPISYLVFAIPPPKPLYVAMTSPMQTLAAKLGVMLLALFGTSAQQRGNVIDVFGASFKPLQLSVEEACSGMKMLIAFFALAVALAYSTARPVWQKVLLAVFALPIAILCNGLRVALTGVMGIHFGEQWTKGATHEYVGMLMLVPAMFMQLGVAWILDHLFVDVATSNEKTGGVA